MRPLLKRRRYSKSTAGPLREATMGVMVASELSSMAQK